MSSATGAPVCPGAAAFHIAIVHCRGMAAPPPSSAVPRPPRVFRLSTRATFRPLAAALLTLLPAALAAQVTTPAVTAPRTLQRVELVRRDIFDDSDDAAWWRDLANRLHVRTQQRVLERELLLRPGDVLDSARAAETARNLRRLQVFRDVSVDTSSDGRVLRIITSDGWTTRPYANLRSTGGQRLFSVGLLETNFLGLATTLDVRYQQDPDRSLLRFAFGAPRLISNRVSTNAFYNRLSDGHSVGAAVEMPYFSLSSRNAARIGFVDFDGRVLRFRNGNPRPADSLSRRFTFASAAISHALRASPRGYLRMAGEVNVRRDDFVPRRDIPVDIPRTTTAAISGYMDVSRADYLVARNFRMMGQPEDVDLSTTLRVGVSLAPAALGYTRTGVGPIISAQTGFRFPIGFAVVAGRVTGLASAGAIDSGTATIGSTLVLQPTSRQVLVAHSSLGYDRNPFPGEEFDLGFTRGPRAFAIHAFTGDRQRFSMLEYRWTALPQIAGSVAVGIAAFAETGGAWFSGSRARDGKDAGIGLRIAPLRAPANLGSTRIDLVHRFATDRDRAGWIVVLGVGFPFDGLR